MFKRELQALTKVSFESDSEAVISELSVDKLLTVYHHGIEKKFSL